MMIERSPNLSAMCRKSYEAVLRFQIYKVKREDRVISQVDTVIPSLCRTGVAQSPCSNVF